MIIAHTNQGSFHLPFIHDRIQKQLLNKNEWEPVFCNIANLYLKNVKSLKNNYVYDFGCNIGTFSIAVAKKIAT